MNNQTVLVTGGAGYIGTRAGGPRGRARCRAARGRAAPGPRAGRGERARSCVVNTRAGDELRKPHLTVSGLT